MKKAAKSATLIVVGRATKVWVRRVMLSFITTILSLTLPLTASSTSSRAALTYTIISLPISYKFLISSTATKKNSSLLVLGSNVLNDSLESSNSLISINNRIFL